MKMQKIFYKTIMPFLKAAICFFTVLLLIGCSNSTKVIRVIDGCTLEVVYNAKAEKVKLLGLEISDKTYKYYNEAKMALSKLVDGKKVTLEFENPDEEKRDKHGNLLCYVYLNGNNVNVEIVRQGFCHFSPYTGAGKLAQKFEKAESEARMNKKGIWK